MQNTLDTQANRLMIVPVYNTMILPETEMTVAVQELSRAEQSGIKSGSEVILLPLRRAVSGQKITEQDFYSLGVSFTVKDTVMTLNGWVLHGKSNGKVTVTEAVHEDVWRATFAAADDVRDMSVEDERELVDHMKSDVTGVLKKRGVQFAIVNLDSIDNVNEFADAFGMYLIQSPDDKYALLQTDSLAERGKLLRSAVDALLRDNEESGDQAGDEAGKGPARRDYRKRVEDSGMPEEVRREVDQILERFEQAQPHDPEKNSMENYLDFITSLKWESDELPPVDIAKARAILNRDHYGLDKVKERILQQMAVMELKKNQAGSILLLVGAPGTGKTSMGRSVAEALGRKFARISLGGVRDEAEIRGHRRTYVGAMPGRVMDGIKKAGSMNPVIVLDEIDKLTQGYTGDPASALLEVLDPEQNNSFTDHYMNVPYDLSNVFFICTANTTQSIPGPLLDRMEVIQLNGYTPSEKLQIAKKYLLPRAQKDAGIIPEDLSVSEDALKRVIEEYTMEAGVRGLKKQLDILCRHTAAEIVEHDKHGIQVEAEQVPTYLGNKRIVHDRILDEDTVGVVTGLAWTQVGGEILYIETKAMHGNGQIILTGQLGDVMKESARISASVVKSLFSRQNPDFSDKDIHIHVPSGSVPKDGPSAGVTLFTALASLVTGVPADRHLAMTGEISLRGQVMPIGGLPEKLMAADRAGITKVLIPSANVQDLEDVPQETRDHLNIIPVKNVREVLHHALGLDVPEPDENLFESRGQVH